MGKTILITGAGSAFGQCLAERLAEAGHRIFASMRDPFGRNREAANRLWSHGIDVLALDVTDETSVAEAMGSAGRKACQIDVVVNNARIETVGTLEASSPAFAQEMMDTNVVGVIRTAQAVLPIMRQNGAGLIINVGSAFGRVDPPFFCIPSAGERALEALTEGLRSEFAVHGVDVVLVRRSVSATSAALVSARVRDLSDAEEVATGSRKPAPDLHEATRVPDLHGTCDVICAMIDRDPHSRSSRPTGGAFAGARPSVAPAGAGAAADS